MTPDSSRSPLASGVYSLLLGAAGLGAMVGVSLAAAALFHAKPFSGGADPASSPVVASRSGLGLQAEVRGRSLQVSWDHAAAAVRNATSGSLTFHDGGTRKTLELSQTAARGGRVFYAARGTEVQVALTILAPDHIMSESINASVPAVAVEAALLPADQRGSAAPLPSRELRAAPSSPEANPLRAGQTGAAAQHPVPKTKRKRPPVAPERGPEAENSALARRRREETARPAPEEAAPGWASKTTDTVTIRVEVDRTGQVVDRVMVPQREVDPAFAERALGMARGWHFEAPVADNQPTTRILEFRQAKR